MTVTTAEELEKLKRIGQIVSLTLREMRKQVIPGITTAELDAIGAALLEKHGAHSAPISTYGFPGATCISLNDEAAHGIPSPDRKISVGDLVNIDVSAEKDGFYADAALTVLLTPALEIKQKLVECAATALVKALHAATAGNRINDIGRASETVAKAYGFHVIKELPGHGVGRGLHEPPMVPGFYMKQANALLEPGMVFTIEPFVSTSPEQVKEMPDGWTLKMPDGEFSAQFEHTIMVTKSTPLILTAA